MATAKEEIELMQHYDYVVVNDQVQHAVDKINAIIQSEHLKVERVVDQIRTRHGNLLRKASGFSHDVIPIN